MTSIVLTLVAAPALHTGLIEGVISRPIYGFDPYTTRYQEPDRGSGTPSLSEDGRYVVFVSAARNLILGDTNDRDDVFRMDRVLNKIERVSITSRGTQVSRWSAYPSMSADGRFITFISDSAEFVRDHNGTYDVFLRDMWRGTTTRVSVTNAGEEANRASERPSISANGRFVVFDSSASNLVAGDTNNAADVFVRDLHLNTTKRVSVTSSGKQVDDASYDAKISADGRYVVFYSWSSDLVPGDTNGHPDVFRHDTLTGTTICVSVSSNGAFGNEGGMRPSISGDGNIISFDSASTNLVPNDTNGAHDVFVRDIDAGITTLGSASSAGVQGDSPSVLSRLSADGRFVAFESDADNLAPLIGTHWHRHVFMRDLKQGTTILISKGLSGEAGNHISGDVFVVSGGTSVAFSSAATNLIPLDLNGYSDIFVWDIVPDDRKKP